MYDCVCSKDCTMAPSTYCFLLLYVYSTDCYVALPAHWLHSRQAGSYFAIKYSSTFIANLVLTSAEWNIQSLKLLFHRNFFWLVGSFMSSNINKAFTPHDTILCWTLALNSRLIYGNFNICDVSSHSSISKNWRMEKSFVCSVSYSMYIWMNECNKYVCWPLSNCSSDC